MSEEAEAYDWRGVPINIGDTVIYGSGVGRSIQLNEATVDGFGPKPESGHRNVKLRIIRRSYMSGIKPVVSVGEDRLTVVTELPPTAKKTQEEQNEEERIRLAKMQANEDSHNFQIVYKDYNFAPRTYIDYEKSFCADCGAVGYRAIHEDACGGGVDG